MRLVLGSASLALVVMALAACSGSNASPEDTTEDQSNAAPAPMGTTPTPAPTTPAQADAGPAPASDGGKGEGGGGGDGGGGGGGDGGGGGKNALCEADSVHEVEANDTAATANAIPAVTGTFCGTLATAADVDFLSFVLPANATKLAFGDAYSQGGVTVEVDVGGEKANVGEKPPFKPGAKYVLKVHTTGKAPANYRVSVTITK